MKPNKITRLVGDIDEKLNELFHALQSLADESRPLNQQPSTLHPLNLNVSLLTAKAMQLCINQIMQSPEYRKLRKHLLQLRVEGVL